MSKSAPLHEIRRSPESVDLIVTWVLHNLCNHSCSYCPSILHDGSFRWVQPDDVRRFVGLVREHYLVNLKRKRIRFQLTGGEPTLFPEFQDLVRYIEDLGMSVGISTNGAQKPGYWRGFARHFDSIAFSFHPEFAKVDRFFDHIRDIHDDPQAPLPAVRFMMHPSPKLWDLCIQTADRFKKEFANYRFEFAALQKNFGTEPDLRDYQEAGQAEFLQKQTSEFRKTRPDLMLRENDYLLADSVSKEGKTSPLDPNDLINRKMASFRDWSCDVGLEQLFVDYFGNVLRAGCRQGGVLGDVRAGKIEFPTESIRCKVEWCHCTTDIMTSKRRDPRADENVDDEKRKVIEATKRGEGTFCVLPWLQSFVNVNGEYQICCTSEGFDNQIVGDDGKTLEISKQPSIDQVMNSEFMKRLRLDMLAGTWSPMCTRCKMTEHFKGASRRQIENRHFADEVDPLILGTQPDGSIPVRIRSADYRLGNLCNLKCRMCGPYSSERWIQDWNKVKPAREQYSQATLEKFGSYKWFSDPGLVREFEAKLADLTHLHFAGGEPLLVPQMVTMLEKCIELGVAHRIELTYNSNITRLPEKVLKLWPSFREVRLLCSVDGYGPLNDYIRTGSKWSDIDRNLKYLDVHASELKVSQVLISTTVQAYNILYIDRLVEYLASEFRTVVKFPNLVNLYGPDNLRSTILPAHLKRLAADRLMAVTERAFRQVPSHKQYLVNNVLEVINFMNSEDASERFPEFLNYSARVDALGGPRLAEVCPDLGYASEFEIRQ
jgi:sulfatase maturation enzyme AslB (radical SAM superfamily)